MKGKVLGVATGETGGAITGDDGKRYRYDLAEWRGERAASIGATVDFEGDGGMAREIYPAVGGFTGAAGAAASVEALARSDAGGRVIGLFRTTLAVPLALVMLIAFFLPALTTPAKTFNLLDLDKLVAASGLDLEESEYGRRRLADLDRDIARFRTEAARAGADAPDGVYGYGNVGDRLQTLETQRGEVRDLLGKIDFLKTVNSALILRFLAVVAALWLIWTAWSGAVLRPWELAAGGAAVVAGGLAVALRSAMLGVMTAGPGVGTAEAAQLGTLFSLGAAPWLMLAAGAALIASGLGLIRNPLARG